MASFDGRKTADQQGASKIVFLQKEAHVILEGPHWLMVPLWCRKTLQQTMGASENEGSPKP